MNADRLLLLDGRRNRAVRIFLLLILYGLLPAVLAGCVGVPVKVPEKKPFSEYVENDLVIGVTNLEEAEKALGSPILARGDWSIHRDERAGWQWAGCAGETCGVDPRGSTPYFLRLEHDASGIVTAYEIVTEDRLCKKYHVCYAKGRVMRGAIETGKDARTGIPGNADRCSIYIYSRRYALVMFPADIVEVTVNGTPVGTLVNPEGYLLATAPVGSAVISIASPHKVLAKELECSGENSIFVRYEWNAGFWGHQKRLIVVAEPEGRSDIESRWQALGAEQPAEP